MPPTSSVVRAARPAFRHSSNFFAGNQAQGAFRAGRQWQWQSGRRWQSTAAPAGEASWFKRMWNSPIGLKTVHFWAPVMKWGIVISGISDLSRPAEKLSLTQNVALTATGIIWTRWCLIIKPKNILLASVNFFLGIVGLAQVTRIILYNRKHKGETAGQQLEEAKQDVKAVAKGLEAKVENAVKS